MNTSALIFWLATTLTVTMLAGYFFYRVLTAKKKNEPDSFSENDQKSK